MGNNNPCWASEDDCLFKNIAIGDDGFGREAVLRLPPGIKMTVMMFGMTGAGKSALGNLMAGHDFFYFWKRFCKRNKKTISDAI